MEAKCYRAMRRAQGKMLREYFSGVPAESLSRRKLGKAVTFALSGRFGDLGHLEYVHAGRTKKAPKKNLRGFVIPIGFKPITF